MHVTILRTNGTTEEHEIPLADIWGRLRDLLQAASFDTVNLRNGQVMLVDDDGYEGEETLQIGVLENRDPTTGRMVPTYELHPIGAKKPVNRRATKLYHRVCRPHTTHQIVGDVAIVTDKDLE